MNSSCAIVVCDHGLGHLRRCTIMAMRLRSRFNSITLYAPRRSFERIVRIFPWATGIKLHDFSTQTSPACMSQGLSNALAWLDRLPNLDGYDTVISDNLPEILSRRPDAIISAQFFWHDIIANSNAYANYCQNLLCEHKPLVIGCDLFAMPAVRLQPRFKPVGLYKNPELVAALQVSSPGLRTDLLVTCGSTSAARIQLARVIGQLLQFGSDPYKNVFVDPELLPAESPGWMLKADYSVSMYCRIMSAICRPGLGVLTDLITVGASIVPVYEETNLEMAFNAKRIRDLSQ